MRVSRFSVAFGFWILGAGLAASCGGEADEPPGGDGDGDGSLGGESGDGDGDTSTGLGGPCTSDKDCRAADGLCDVGRSVCVECLTALDCGDSAECRSGVCEAFTSCQSSKDCPVDQVCDLTLERCVECLGDNDCAEGQACVASVCATSCASDKTCSPEGKVCNLTTGVCAECVTLDDCEGGQYCSADGACQAQICEPDAAHCEGDTVYTCNAAGDGYAQAPCEFGCDPEGVGCADEGGNGTGGGDPGTCDPRVRILVQRSGSMFEWPSPEVNWWGAISDALDNDGTDLLDQFSSQVDISLSTFHMVETNVTCPLLVTQPGPIAPNGLAAFLDAEAAAHAAYGIDKVDAPLPEAVDQAVTALGSTGDRYILLIVIGMPDTCDAQDGICGVEPSQGALQAAHAAGVTTKVLHFALGTEQSGYVQGLANAGLGQFVDVTGTELYGTCAIGADVYGEPPGSATYESPADVSDVVASLTALLGQISTCD